VGLGSFYHSMSARIVFVRQGMTKKSRVNTADGEGERWCVLEFLLNPIRVEKLVVYAA
jgi:hypothetical protein